MQIKQHKRKIALVIAILIVGIIAIPKCKCDRNNNINFTPNLGKSIKPTKIDTTSKPFILPKIQVNNIPVKRKVYIKKDTALRKQVEKGDIVIHEEIKDGEIIKDIIDSSGVITEEINEAPIKITGDAKAIEINQAGEIEVKEKTKAGKFLAKVWNRTKKAGKGIVIGLAVVGVAAIILAGN